MSTLMTSSFTSRSLWDSQTTVHMCEQTDSHIHKTVLAADSLLLPVHMSRTVCHRACDRTSSRDSFDDYWKHFCWRVCWSVAYLHFRNTLTYLLTYVLIYLRTYLFIYFPAVVFASDCHHTCDRTSATDSLGNYWKHFCLRISWPWHAVTSCMFMLYLLTYLLTYLQLFVTDWWWWWWWRWCLGEVGKPVHGVDGAAAESSLIPQASVVIVWWHTTSTITFSHAGWCFAAKFIHRYSHCINSKWRS